MNSTAEQGPKPAWLMTSEEFLGPCLVSPSFSIDASGGVESEEYGIFFTADTADRPLWSSPDGRYAVHSVADKEHWEPFPTVLLKHNGKTIGFYAAGEAWVDEEHRGGGLGVEMIVAAAELCGSAPNRNAAGPGYSEAGYRAHLAAHRAIVERAVAAGRSVPVAVLAELDRDSDDHRPRAR